MIFLDAQHIQEMETHGKEAYPEECCGAMLGHMTENGDKTVVKLVRIENSSAQNRHRRFEVTAGDYMRLEKEAKQLSLQLLGFYHTHPDHPAEPSQTDLQYAWPFFSYIILSVRNGKASEMNSFELDPDASAFAAEVLQVS